MLGLRLGLGPRARPRYRLINLPPTEEEPDPDPEPGSFRLKYSPPDYSGYTVINVPASGTGTNGRFAPTLNSSTDYVFVFPNEKRTGVVRIEGGRNIVIIGGECEVVTWGGPGGSWQDQDRRAVYFLNNTGNIYVEGMYVHANSVPNDWDAFYFHNASTVTGKTITIQNCRIENIRGEPGASPAFHGDAFQIQDTSVWTGTVRWYNVTVTTNYQGYYALHEGVNTVTNFERVNWKITEEKGVCLWIGDHEQEYWSKRYTNLGPDVYLAPLSNGILSEVRPNTDSPDVSDRPVLSDGVLTWPNSSHITGELRDGDPPDGDFVKAEDVGVGYVSPGYEV